MSPLMPDTTRHDVIVLWAIGPRNQRPQFVAAWPASLRDALPEQLATWMRDAVESYLDYCPDGDPSWFSSPDERWRFETSGHTIQLTWLDDRDGTELREVLGL